MSSQLRNDTAAIAKLATCYPSTDGYCVRRLTETGGMSTSSLRYGRPWRDRMTTMLDVNTREGAASDAGQLHRTIDWRGAFWIASGVPALVLFSIGGSAGTTENVAV